MDCSWPEKWNWRARADLYFKKCADGEKSVKPSQRPSQARKKPSPSPPNVVSVVTGATNQSVWEEWTTESIPESLQVEKALESDLI